MNINESRSISFDIPEITAEKARAALRENVSESAIIPAATAALIYQYAGSEKIKPIVRTADSYAEIEIDAACVIPPFFDGGQLTRLPALLRLIFNN